MPETKNQAITAEGMMAYVRVQMTMRNEADAQADKIEHQRTFAWHVSLVITGVALAAVAAFFGLDIYLSIALGGIPQVTQEIIDIVKDIG
jgi:hypothetical protein